MEYTLRLNEPAMQFIVNLIAGQPINVAGDLFADVRRQVAEQEAAAAAVAREQLAVEVRAADAAAEASTSTKSKH